MSEVFRAESRKDFHRDGQPSNEDIQIGCLQRIADAAELMAKEHARLVRDRDYYERGYRERGAEIERLIRQRSALRGAITRMKRSTDSTTEPK